MSSFKLKYSPNCPIDIFNHEELNNNEKMVYIVIHNIIGQNKKCTLINEEIATASNTSLATVKRAISKLQDLDLIWLDVDRKRTVKDPNEAVRHIYTNYKYYTDRNKKDKAIHMPKSLTLYTTLETGVRAMHKALNVLLLKQTDKQQLISESTKKVTLRTAF